MKPNILVVFLALFVSLHSSRGEGIYYKPGTREFHIVGKSSVYAFQAVEDLNLLTHLYWGALDPELVASGAAENLPSFVYLFLDCNPVAFDPWIQYEFNNFTKLPVSRNALMLEWAEYGSGDYRFPSMDVTFTEDGSRAFTLQYISHEIFPGKPSIDPAQPAFYIEDVSEATSLRLLLEDPLTGLQVELYYTIYTGTDTIIRRAVILNNAAQTIEINSIMSATVDFPAPIHSYTMSHLSGSWSRERHLVTNDLKVGTHQINSRRGLSSHQHNPFVVISDGPYSEDTGEHFAFTLVYAGSFTADAEISQTGRLRMSMGILPLHFHWTLARGQRFVAPEIALTYSNSGVGTISRELHRLMRLRLARGFWRDLPRPMLVNSWEAMYFDVSEDKIIERLAEPASQLGFDLVVLDDGWFGERNNATTSLGDWYPNPIKFPNGLSGVANRVNALGLSFGIWMEPEMINVKSNLYEQHPDWPLHVGKRPRSETRNQLVLDLSRPDVRDFIVDAVSQVLDSANITYLKWDFNRHLSEVGSAYWPAEQQGEVHHRFVLGIYDIMERVTTKYPRVLFESCSGGGGRFDAALLYYMPQIWASDNTDAISRLKIQYGTSIAYPASALVAHVSESPNDQVGRTTDLLTRTRVAMGGMMGYELNLLEMSDEDRIQVPKHIQQYREIESIVRTGTMYRLMSPFEEKFTPRMAAWSFVSDDKSRAVVFAFNSDYFEKIWSNPRLRMQGLDPYGCYDLEGSYIEPSFRARPGSMLMHGGFVIYFYGDGESVMVVMTKRQGLDLRNPQNLKLCR